MSVPAKLLRTLMLSVFDEDMASGDFVFIDVDNLYEEGWSLWNETWAGGADGRDQDARRAAENLMIVRLSVFMQRRKSCQ